MNKKIVVASPLWKSIYPMHFEPNKHYEKLGGYAIKLAIGFLNYIEHNSTMWMLLNKL